MNKSKISRFFDLHKWKLLVQQSNHPVVITGAGISVASGLPTLSQKWKGIKIRDFFTFEMFQNLPDQFFHYYRHIISHWHQAQPNMAHYALAEYGVPIITQNIDGLHQKAGSRHVLELHGNLLELKCLRCDSLFSSDLAKRSDLPKCPTCLDLLKPNIVLVGEEVYHYSTAVDWVGKSDLLLIVGTRLEMAPCKELPIIAERKEIPIVRINQQAEIILPILFH